MRTDMYDEYDPRWWSDGRWADRKYCYFEDPEKYRLAYNEVLDSFANDEMTYSSMEFSERLKKGFLNMKFKGVFCYLIYKKDSDASLNDDFKKLFDIFVYKYMNSLIETLYLRCFFYSNGLGYGFPDDRVIYDLFNATCSIDFVFFNIFPYRSYFYQYFEKNYSEEFNFRETHCGLQYGNTSSLNKVTLDGLRNIIPKKYVSCLDNFDINNNNVKREIIFRLDGWWRILKYQCREYLRLNGELPICGNKLLGSFSSLDDLLNKINEVRVFLGYDLLDMESEIRELNTPSADPKKVADALFKDWVDFDFDIDLNKPNNDSYQHDYIHGMVRRRIDGGYEYYD